MNPSTGSALPFWTFVAALLVLLSGCGKSNSDRIEATTPQKAASTLDQAFQSAPAPVKENIHVVSEAMRKGEYDKAVISLQTVKEQGNVTLDQGMAIHGAVLSMESQLIQAIQSGDANAARAYELLRAMKRQ